MGVTGMDWLEEAMLEDFQIPFVDGGVLLQQVRGPIRRGQSIYKCI